VALWKSHVGTDIHTNLKGRGHSEDLGLDGRILEWFLEKLSENV
jgi:hypothetical protein